MPLVYKSRHAGLVMNVRSAWTDFHPITGAPLVEHPAIRCEFGVPGPTVSVRNPLTGQMDEFETFRGGVYDLDSDAEEKGWDADIKQMVQNHLDKRCQQIPDTIQKVDYLVPPAPRPWPTYDDMSSETEIAEMAAKLGLIQKTLDYERENRQRGDLIAVLERTLEESPDPVQEPAPVVAVEPPRVQEELKSLKVGGEKAFSV